jgi:hypothetical protein
MITGVMQQKPDRQNVKVRIVERTFSKRLNMSSRIIVANLLVHLSNIIMKKLVQDKNAGIRGKRNT